MPIIVAESLEPVERPIATLLRVRGSGSPADVIARMAGCLAREQDPRPQPGWLRPEQQRTIARLLPMLRDYRCALLADPVGSGKTYIALAAAASWPSVAQVIVLAPAALIGQWHRLAARLGISLTLWSHERLSRGSVPPGLLTPGASLVIIDESHHFRSPATRRYQYLAPRLIGRTVLLLSATPVVNGLRDLASQLALGARDDSLAASGIISLQAHLSGDSRASPALGELVLCSLAPVSGRPGRIVRREAHVDPAIEERCRRIERLALSESLATRSLLRTVLWRAMASSDMALLGVLRRYRSLLAHARDAAECGQRWSRTRLRSLVGEDADQLTMWSLLPSAQSDGDMVLDDLEQLDVLIGETRAASRVADNKCLRLLALLDEPGPTLVFTGARDTVRYLRDHIPHAAWCTGEAAGIGITRMGRDDVLSWFRPGAGPGGPPVLVTTDVSAEGLDLQLASRVVHYDLPWTAVRLDQRDGRAIRLGSRHERVDVVRFAPPPALERRLRQVGILARKRRLPGRAGLDRGGGRLWTWRDEMAGRFGNHPPAGDARFARVASERRGILAAVTFNAAGPDGRPRRAAIHLGFLAGDGTWHEDLDLMTRLVEEAGAASPSKDTSPPREETLRRLAAIVGEKLRAGQLARWSSRLTVLQERAIARLNRVAGRAVHERNGPLLSSVERAMNFVRRGHTAGESMWLDQALALPDSALIREIGRCPDPGPATTTLYCELIGLVEFAPSSSISTAP